MNPKIVYGIEKMLAHGNVGGALALLGVGAAGVAVKAIADKRKANKGEGGSGK